MSKTKSRNELTTISDLARKHGIDRGTVRSYLDKAGLTPTEHRGQSSLYDATLADEAIRIHRAGGKGANAELRAEKLREEIRKLKIANDERQGGLITRFQFESEVREMSSEVQRQLYAIPARAPELAGLPPAEIEQRLTAMIDGAVLNLASAAQQIAPDKCPCCQQAIHAPGGTEAKK